MPSKVMLSHKGRGKVVAMVIKKGGRYLVIKEGKLVGVLKDGELAREIMSWINKRTLMRLKRGI